MVTLRGPQAFQWSSSEQEYPFEKDINGNTLYCKELYAPNGPNNSTVFLPHGISSYNPSKIKRVNIRMPHSSTNDCFTFPDGAWGSAGFDCTHNIDTNNVNIVSTRNLSGYRIRVEIIYSKV
jgi:hypothetical protein